MKSRKEKVRSTFMAMELEYWCVMIVICIIPIMFFLVDGVIMKYFTCGSLYIILYLFNRVHVNKYNIVKEYLLEEDEEDE